MSAGDHTICANGFQAGGELGLVVEYNGPDTGGQTILLKSSIVCTEMTLGCRKTMSFLKHPDGSTWKNDNNAIRLDRVTEMTIAYYDGGDVYAHTQGSAALLQDDNMKLSVRHTGNWMYTHQFAANNATGGGSSSWAAGKLAEHPPPTPTFGGGIMHIIEKLQ